MRDEDRSPHRIFPIVCIGRLCSETAPTKARRRSRATSELRPWEGHLTANLTACGMHDVPHRDVTYLVYSSVQDVNARLGALRDVCFLGRWRLSESRLSIRDNMKTRRTMFDQPKRACTQAFQPRRDVRGPSF